MLYWIPLLRHSYLLDRIYQDSRFLCQKHVSDLRQEEL